MNHSVFDEPLSEEARYWIGLLMADGSVGGRHHPTVIRLGLTESDFDHLMKLHRFVDARTKISFVDRSSFPNSKGAAVLNFSSQRITDQLAKYGVVNRKSLKEVAPTELLFDRDFWRGVVDGDGTVMKAKMPKGRWRPWITLCGSIVLVGQFGDFVEQIIGRKPALQVKESGIAYMSIAGFKALQVIRTLYQDSKVSLDRKMKCAEECFGWIPLRNRPDHPPELRQQVTKSKRIVVSFYD